MPNPTWTCCADLPACTTCPDSCDFATSYTFDGFALNFTFAVDHGACPKCTYEGGGGGGAFYQRSYSVNVTVTQIGAAILNRHGTGTCCYSACGTFEVEWEITEDVVYGCCQPEDQGSPIPAVECSGNQTITGVEAVPYTYTIHCETAPIDGCPDDAKLGAVWVHTIQLKGVQVATSHENYVADCDYNPLDVDCGEEPAGPLYMSGMTLRWWTPLIALNAIVPGMENTMCGPWAQNDSYIPNCPLPSGCASGGSPYGQGICGPFSVGLDYGGLKFPTNEFCVASLVCPNPPFPFNVCPCGQVSSSCICRRIDGGHQTAYPNYV